MQLYVTRFGCDKRTDLYGVYRKRERAKNLVIKLSEVNLE
jgi:hypothetical protein